MTKIQLNDINQSILDIKKNEILHFRIYSVHIEITKSLHFTNNYTYTYSNSDICTKDYKNIVNTYIVLNNLKLERSMTPKEKLQGSVVLILKNNAFLEIGLYNYLYRLITT